MNLKDKLNESTAPTNITNNVNDNGNNDNNNQGNDQIATKTAIDSEQIHTDTANGKTSC